MEKVDFTLAQEVKTPVYKSQSDAIQITELMRRFGESVGLMLASKVFGKIVKEFQRAPSESKIFKFTLTCEEINAD